MALMGAGQYLNELETFLTNVNAYEEHRLKLLREQLATRIKILAELKKRGR